MNSWVFKYCWNSICDCILYILPAHIIHILIFDSLQKFSVWKNVFRPQVGHLHSLYLSLLTRRRIMLTRQGQLLSSPLHWFMWIVPYPIQSKSSTKLALYEKVLTEWKGMRTTPMATVSTTGSRIQGCDETHGCWEDATSEEWLESPERKKEGLS